MHRVEFRLCAEARLDGHRARGEVSVYLGAILVSQIPLRIAVSISAAESAASDHAVDCARRYRKIFASYSHRDTAVVDQFEQFARALGDRYLRDTQDLRAGEVWSPRLEELIKEADVFQLFWSYAAMHSTFVRQEWEFALALSRERFLRPVFWERPMPRDSGLPPPDLARLHFQEISVPPSASPDVATPPAGRVGIEDPGLEDADRPVLGPPARRRPAEANTPSADADADTNHPMARFAPRLWLMVASMAGLAPRRRLMVASMAVVLLMMLGTTFLCFHATVSGGRRDEVPPGFPSAEVDAGATGLTSDVDCDRADERP